jgi:hypothetical protein
MLGSDAYNFLVLGRLRQENHKFQVNLGCTVRPYCKKKRDLINQDLLNVFIIL